MFGYVLFIMISFRKHTLEEAAKCSGLNKAQFSRFLKNHHKDAVANLNHLSKKQAKKVAKFCKGLAKGVLPWQIAVIIDATIQNRSSLHTDNSQKFNHGCEYVIGHQWTNILLLINEIIIPLPPIAIADSILH